MASLTEIARLTAAHVGLCVASVAVAGAVALPLGILVTRAGTRRLAAPVLAMAGAAQTLPSLAVIALGMILFGLGAGPAIAALAVYSLLPLLHNTVAGLANVPADLREAALGQGLSPPEVLWQVELPVALPVILAGLRTSVVLAIGTAALASEVGAPCLGNLIFQGVSTGSVALILQGAVPTALLAIAADLVLGWVEHAGIAEGLR